MLKGKGKNGARDVVILGFSRENITRMMQGERISFTGEEIGFPNCDVLIFMGENEIEMLRNLPVKVAIETSVHVDQTTLKRMGQG